MSGAQVKPFCRDCGEALSDGCTCRACEQREQLARAFWTQARVTAAIEQGKAEILADIASGRVPADVSTFAALHDYVDANEYGGLCEKPIDPSFAPANEIQNALDAWLSTRHGGAA